jgi:hypothetical protein
LRRALLAAAVVALGAAGAAAASPRSQDVVLPGPVPYPTQSPPLVGKTVVGGAFTRYVFHIASDQRVVVGIDEQGSPVFVRDAQRLDVRGRGDYQFAIPGPIDDVLPGPGSESDPGLRADQVLWAGFSPGRKILAADVSLRTADASQYLPLRLRLSRSGEGVTLEATNATTTSQLEYGGRVRAPQIAGLLDRTRGSARAGRRLAAAYATFYGAVQQSQRAQIEAPLRVEGELRAGDGEPVRFSRILGDGFPLTLRVHASGDGKPRVRLNAVPVPVDRLLRPLGGAPTWTAALRRRPLPAPSLLRRLLETRMRLVRADQYQSFLSNPDADGRSRSVYVYRSAAAPRAVAASAPAPKESGSGPLVLVLAVAGAVLVAGFGLVAWAHS